MKKRTNKTILEGLHIFIYRKEFDHLVEALGFAHGALDVQGTHVLPILLQKRHQEVDSQVNIVDQLILCHLHMAHSNSQTKHLQNSKQLID